MRPKRSTRCAPSDNDQLKVHIDWYKTNDAQAKALREKMDAGKDLAPKEADFLSWWNGYCAANPDPERLPKYSTMVIRRDKDPME